MKLALANLPMVWDLQRSLELCLQAIRQAGEAGLELIVFPECYLPGYREPGRDLAAPNQGALEAAWTTIARLAQELRIAVVLGTERLTSTGLRASALVIDRDGAVLGFQDKVQLDPSEDGIYEAGPSRQLFSLSGRALGIVICHEGWRYPETVRWLALQGAQLVLHLQYHGPLNTAPRPADYGALRGSFHEGAVLCRAAENEVWVASVNAATPNSATTSVIADPDGQLLCYQAHGASGLLTAEIDLDRARRRLAGRLRPIGPDGLCQHLTARPG